MAWRAPGTRRRLDTSYLSTRRPSSPARESGPLHRRRRSPELGVYHLGLPQSADDPPTPQSRHVMALDRRDESSAATVGRHLALAALLSTGPRPASIPRGRSARITEGDQDDE